MHKPSWFRDDEVLVSFAPTCGIYKKGEERFRIDAASGRRTKAIDDLLREDVDAAVSGRMTETLRWVGQRQVVSSPVVPAYFDDRPVVGFRDELARSWPEYSAVSLGELVDGGQLLVRGGHGSPSADVRTGSIPYIKVSDIRAGQVNVNPTNRVTEVVARKHWGGSSSGLQPFDIVTPNRASKNIGEVAMLMPGQERIVLTKEVFVFRPAKEASFDAFYLMWALTLRVVREQWRRVVFMQTNREDVGQRYREILIPLPLSQEDLEAVARPFRSYYEGVISLRQAFVSYLEAGDLHHVFVASSAAAELATADQADVEQDDS
jgi:hypothetical protein